MESKIYSFLGLAKKAGKLVSGDFACETAVKSGKCSLIVIAGDASENTRKKFTNTGKFYQVATRVFGNKEALGKYIGKEYRAVVGVVDQGFAGKISEMIDEQNIENGGEVNG